MERTTEKATCTGPLEKDMEVGRWPTGRIRIWWSIWKRASRTESLEIVGGGVEYSCIVM